ncbi:putative (R)-citramalate synthase CimA [Gottschalkia purinilytica]|uniref:Putative (R)-citramalate synthase CimA n=1 Tax=Gottschalkia purinilytica TaxID=1503 RepID=A0A0L0WEW6_GOTPU|nr:2-isopropylmalate synthase [Gottschalkia purinilytica]KNF10014.1 putative (R)-citramalate synthase CimA [Gottschalkia purinilytica]
MKDNGLGMTQPNLFKETFPYSEIPKTVFNNVLVPMDLPEKIWITDTTFRDGQQSMSSFTVDQIATIYDYLHKLDNGSGIIRQTEFFLYTEKDRKAVEECMKRGYEFPQITSWIRAKKEDLQLVKEMGIKETGMLMSCSDYHIFDKLKMNREQAMNAYLSIAENALENGIIPRCHLEDITRADFFGFVVPFVQKLMELSEKSGLQVKIRACDTLGLGVPYNGVELPRSVPAIIHGLRKYAGVPSDSIEWHGHNDFYSVVTNSATSWLYGSASVNTTLFGIGERTGNCPLEAMVVEYGQLKGSTKDMDLTIITEIADYFKKELDYEVPQRTPFVGSEFNVTRAGIHADGLLKNEEIYNAFDTSKILNRPALVAVNEYSGVAGIAAWINGYFKLKGSNKLNKKDSRILPIKKWVDEQYENGRTTVIRNDELESITLKYITNLLEEKDDEQAVI